MNTVVAEVAAMLRLRISREADELGVSVCELEAEILSQSLLSDDCDTCHIHWLEFHTILESKLKQNGKLQ